MLEALIHAELSKFQQQQADKYAARASEGQALVPLSSPAPRQQQLRAQQKHQEALIGERHRRSAQATTVQQPSCPRTAPSCRFGLLSDPAADAASIEEQERIEYVPSTRTTLEPEQLQRVLPSTDSCSHLLQQQQQGQQPQDPAQLCSEPEGTTACADTHIVSAEPSSVAAADAAQAAGCSSSCAEAVAAAAAETEPLQLHVLMQPNGQAGPVQMECVLQDLSKLQLVHASQGSITLQCSGTQEKPEAAAAGVCSAQDSTLLQESSPPPQQPLRESSDDAVECPELPQEQQPQQELSEGPLQQHQEACEWQDGGQDELEQQAQEQQQQQDEQHGEEESLSHTPEAVSQQSSQAACRQQLAPAESEALGDEAAASPAAAGAPERMPVLSDTRVSDAAEGFICQYDSRQSASLSSPDSSVQATAEDSSSQAAAARASSDACAVAAAAAFAAMSLGAAGAGELWNWETYTADAAGRSSAQQPQMPSSCRQSNTDSSTRSSPRLRQQSPRQQWPQQQSPRRQQPPQQQQSERRASAELSSPAPPQYAPRPQQHCQQARGAGPRPSSAPAGGSRRQLAVAMTGPAAAQLALRQASLQAPSGAQPADRVMPVVAESSQEGQCGCSGWGVSKSHPSPGSPMQFYSGAAAAAGWTAAMHHQQRHAEEQYQHAILARMQQLQPQQPSRPVSAGPWRSAQRPQLSLQPGQRQVPAWDDSPMPLDIPGRVPIAQAVQLPSTTVASNAAYVRSWGTCSPGSSSSILGGGRAAALAAASRAAAGSRPQTAGPVMVGRVKPWESAQLLLQNNCSQQLKGCRTARSASSSPGRRRAALLPTPQAAPAATAAAATEGEAGYCVEEAAGHSSMQVTSGCSGKDCSSLDELAVSPAEAVNSSLTGARAPAAAPYLLGALQQVRQANSYCRQLGLCTQYKLAEGSSRKDRWQLEQIQVELWTSIDPGAGPCEVLSCGITGSKGGGSSGTRRWQRKKSLSLQQLTAHLNRLKGSVTPTAGVAAGLAAAVRPRHSTHAALPASRAAAAAGGGIPNGAAAAQLSRSAQRLQSPDRARSRHFGGSQAAPVGGGLGGAGQAGSRVVRACSVRACRLLVLSPRGSSCGDQVQCLVRPASAPKSRSRLSPPRQEHV